MTKPYKIKDIASLMKKSGLSDIFTNNATRTAKEYGGVYDLMVLWIEETDEYERELIIADIQSCIEDCEDD